MNTDSTEAQRSASISNGMKSQGPTTEAGKATSAMNGVRHGLASRSVLLPSETTSDYEANVKVWLDTLQPTSPGEAEIVARVADLNFRLRRLQRLEDKHLAANMDAKLKASEISKKVSIASNASLGLTAMISMASEVQGPCSAQRVSGLLPPIRTVLDMVEAVDLPPAATVKMDAVYQELVEQVDADAVAVEIFDKLSDVGSELVVVLDDKLTELTRLVGIERDRIADDLLLGDDKELKRFERHRAAINKTLDAELARIKVVRELAHRGPGSSVGPFLIELKLIGRP